MADEVSRGLRELSGPIETREEEMARTSDPEFIELNEKARKWVAGNKLLREMHEIAIEDYVAARHTILGLGLFNSGHSLAAQAVEKLLKSFRLINDPTYNPWNDKHRIVKIAAKVEEIYSDIDLSPYSDFLTNLQKWYNSRYPNSPNSASQWGRNTVDTLDQLVVYLEESMPIPQHLVHLKYGGGELGHDWPSVFVRLFNAFASSYQPALLRENKALIPRLEHYQALFFEHRMSAVLPCQTLREVNDHAKKTYAYFRENPAK